MTPEELDTFNINKDKLDAIDEITGTQSPDEDIDDDQKVDIVDRNLLRYGSMEETKRYTSKGENSASYVVTDKITYYEEHSIE